MHISLARGVEWRENELVKRHVKDARERELCLLWMSFRHLCNEYRLRNSANDLRYVTVLLLQLPFLGRPEDGIVRTK